jgi:hypothetical protein
LVQPNLDPTYALAKDISDAQARIGRLEQADITIAGLHDVAITSPTNTQVLTYNTALQKWINATGGGGGASFTVSATAPASPVNGAGWYNLTNGYIFFYINDGDSSQWVQDTSIANDAGYESRLTALETFNTVAQPVSVGGTGASTLSAGGYLKGNGTSAITAQAGIPGSDITSGTVGVSVGGTGASTFTSGAYLKGAGTAAITSQTGIPAGDITSGTLDALRLPPGTVVGFNRKRTAARSAYGYNSDAIISDLNISITPKYASSLLLVQWAVMYEADYNSVFRVYRDGGLVYTSGYQGYNENDGNAYSGVASLQYDTDVASTPSNQMVQYFVPAGSTNATTLQLAVRTSGGQAATFYLNRPVNSGGASQYEIGVSSAVIWEIAQ